MAGQFDCLFPDFFSAFFVTVLDESENAVVGVEFVYPVQLVEESGAVIGWAKITGGWASAGIVVVVGAFLEVVSFEISTAVGFYCVCCC